VSIGVCVHRRHEPASLPTEVKEVLTLLVNSELRGKMVRSYVRRLEVRDTKHTPLEKLTLRVLKIGCRELTNRVHVCPNKARDPTCGSKTSGQRSGRRWGRGGKPTGGRRSPRRRLW
jgi:hypothetical protein